MEKELLARFDRMEERFESKLDTLGTRLEKNMDGVISSVVIQLNQMKNDFKKKTDEVKADIRGRRATGTSWKQTLLVAVVTTTSVFVAAWLSSPKH